MQWTVKRMLQKVLLFFIKTSIELASQWRDVAFLLYIFTDEFCNCFPYASLGSYIIYNSRLINSDSVTLIVTIAC